MRAGRVLLWFFKDPCFWFVLSLFERALDVVVVKRERVFAPAARSRLRNL